MKNLKGFIFMAEDVENPENEESYDIDKAIDSTNSITSSEDFIEFVNEPLFDNAAEDICYLFLDARNRIIDCGLASKFVEQTEADNTFINYFI